MRAPSVPAQLPAPGVLGPARTAPPPLRTRGGVPSPSPSPPEPLRTPAAMCHPFAELQMDARPCRARAACHRICTRPRSRARGAFRRRCQPHPNPFLARAARRRVCTWPRSRARGGVLAPSPTPPGPFCTLALVCQGGQAGAVRPVPPFAKGEAAGEAPRAIRGKAGTGPGRGDCGGSLSLLYSPRREGGAAQKCRARAVRVGPVKR